MNAAGGTPGPLRPATDLGQHRAMSTKTPRLTPLAEAEMTDEVRAIVAPSIGGFGRVLNIFATLARHPKLLKRFQLFGALMLSGQLPARERELLILRTAWNCDAEYEWGHHDAIGRAVGLTPDEVARVADGPDAPGLGPVRPHAAPRRRRAPCPPADRRRRRGARSPSATTSSS